MSEREEYRLLETKYLEKGIDYTGRELRSHFIRETGGIAGDGVVAFQGGCRVEAGDLVDLDDAEQNNYIRAERMLHFIGEHFQCGLREGNFRLRLFVSIVRDSVEKLSGSDLPSLIRRGDDLFTGDRKLSVAIATRSPTSMLFHLGVNIDPAGAPVSTVGIEEWGIPPPRLAEMVLQRYSRECSSIEFAVRKVRGVT